MKKTYEFTIDEENLGYRVDQFLSDAIPELSRTYIKKLIEENSIIINSTRCKTSYKLQFGDKVIVEVPEPEVLDIKAENIEIDIVYEDDHVLVVNKPQGMVVHPAPGNYQGTLVNALLYHIENLSDISGVLRPGIVHRIDKDTSGLLLVAKSDLAHKSLSNQLKAHTINRKYIALVEGYIQEESGTIDAPIGRHHTNRKQMTVTDKNSKNAITQFSVLRRFSKNTLIEAKLKTGRTHQIRVHMTFIGHPVVGDATYGLKKQNLYSKGQLLHARLIGFDHPATGEYMEFISELPDYFTKVLKGLS